MNTSKWIKEEFSGSIAKSYVGQIAGHHRIQASTGYSDAASFIEKELKRLGLSDVEILRFVADGKKKYWLYRSSPGWTVRSAELRMVEPKEELLATYDDVPTSLHAHSQRTPADGVTAELVDVGAGTSAKDFKGKKVKGRLVLAKGDAHAVHIEAVIKRGAVGVITDTFPYEFPRVRQSIDVPDANAYQGIWPDSRTAKKTKFGFSLTKRQGEELRVLLAKERKVVLKAKVDASLRPGNYEVVTATIRGSKKPNEEVFLIAHLCHPKPGANDNASGSGVLIEMARTLTSLIDSHKIQRPARTLRFFWVPETMGTAAVLSTRPEMRDKLLAGLNLDMVGEDQEQCESTLSVTLTPDSLPSYLNDLVMLKLGECAKELDPFVRIGLASKFRYTSTPFSAGSDHAEFVESTVGVPCVSLTQWPDKFYHTSMDTIDKVSEESLRRVGWTATATALTLANSDARTAHELAILTFSRGEARIAESARKATAELFRIAEDQKVKNKGQELAKQLKLKKTIIGLVVQREQRAVGSVLGLSSGEELQDVVKSLAGSLSDAGEKSIAILEETVKTLSKSIRVVVPSATRETKAEKEAKQIVPKRLFKGSVPWWDFLRLMSEDERSSYKKIDESDSDFGSKILEASNLMDGRRTVYDVVMALSAEYGPTSHENVLKLVHDMERFKLVSLKRTTAHL